MDQPAHNKIAAFICGIANDALRNLTSRGCQQQLLADFEDYLNDFLQKMESA